jgi:divalent metal cation (Fe/Co/Zn/Cd) transporter
MVPTQAERLPALRGGIRLEIFTVSWMVVEAVVAIGAGLAARSVLLTAFGLDSAIELLSGVTLLWRLSAEAGSGEQERVERVERRATLVSAVLLALLCVYLVTTSILGLAARLQARESWVGIGISAAALVVMPLLAWRKLVVNETIQSAALRADVAETVTCAWMAGVTLIGVTLSSFAGWWWVEYVAALALLFFVGREAWEALEDVREGGKL